MIVFPFSFMDGTGSGPAPGPTTLENYYSVDFDGTDDYVDLGTNVLFDSTSAFSVSGWIKLTSYSPSYPAMILLKTDQATGVHIGFSDVVGYQGVWFGSNSNFIRLSTLDATLASTLINGSWHHIVLTYDGVSRTTASSYTLYVNGSSKSLGSAGPFASVPNENRIGKGSNSATVFNGPIDEVGIWDVELDSDAVTALYNSGSPISLSSDSGDYDNSSSLKGWWRMGDGANYPIVKNQAHFSQTALEFDGSNDYVDLGRIEPSTTALSISFWLYLTNSATSQGLVTKYASTDYGVNIWGGSLHFFIKTTSWDSISVADYLSLYSNQWVHICCTWDGSTRKIYLNGTEEATGSKTGSITYASNNTRLGNLEGAGGFQFGGNMDDVSFYDVGLSASDVTDIYNSGYPKDESERSGLVAYYKFDGDTYPVVKDALQFSNASLDFDGTNDYVDLGTGFNSSLELGDSFSISVWVKFGNTGTNRHIISNADSAYKGLHIRLLTTEKIRFIIAENTSWWYYIDSSVLSVDTWHHFVATYDGSDTLAGLNVYVNGSLDNATTAESGTKPTSITSADSLKIGKYTGGEFYPGNIDDVIVFNAELSASDVTNIYNSGKPKDESSLSNILGYWRMGDNTISPNVPSALGYGTHSVEFDGALDRVDISSLASTLQSENTFSVSFWAKSSYHNLNPAFATSTGNDANKAFLIYPYDTNAGTHDCRVWYNGASIISTGNNSLTGWNHFCYVQNGATSHTVYINGSSAGTSSTSKTLDSGLDTCDIGGTAEFSQFFEGNIKQVGIFDSALSASDVTSIYNSGLPKDISSESGLVSYYRMGDGEDKFPNILDYKGTNHGTMTNMASDDITTANVGSGTMTNMDSADIVADSPSGTSGQMTNMDSGDFVGAKEAGTMINMDAEDIVADVPKAFFDVDFLVVAGGGAGGQANVLGHVSGGGGGAGGLRTSYGSNSGGGSSAESAFSAEIGTSYTVTVGAGGAAQSSSSEFVGNPGNNSVFATITSIGGGGGGGNNLNATTGGSGGGGSESDGAGAAGTANQGYAGGTGSESGNRGGGGGGAGGVGGTTDGGVGLSVSITGSAVFYAGGGASSGTGGNGGGGNNRTDGTPNTGGGGGSDQTDNPDAVGAGGSGIVILRYPNTRTITVGSGLTSSTTTDGSDKVTTFTAGTDTVSFS